MLQLYMQPLRQFNINYLSMTNTLQNVGHMNKNSAIATILCVI